MTRIGDFDLDEGPPERARAGWDPGADYAARCAAVVGPLRGDGFPALGAGLSCDPGTGGGQCLRLRIRTHRRPAPAPWGWEAGEQHRQADAAWWQERGRLLGGEPLPELDVDASLPDRGAWVTGE